MKYGEMSNWDISLFPPFWSVFHSSFLHNISTVMGQYNYLYFALLWYVCLQERGVVSYFTKLSSFSIIFILNYFILILFKDKSKTKNTHSENMWIKLSLNSIKVNAYWRQYKKETLDMPIYTKNRNKFTCCYLFKLS